MWRVQVTKTIEDGEDEIVYTFAATAETEAEAIDLVLLYISMVEYGLIAQRYAPGEMAFPFEQLYQFIQRSTLEQITAMYPDVVSTAYMNAMAYVQSYIGAMFDVDAMLQSEETSSTTLTLRLALCIKTATFILASSPQYSEVTECHEKQLHMLLKGLKSGSRNMGKGGIISEPDVRAAVVSIGRNNRLP